MAKTVVMPQMGYDMDAGTLLRWLKQEGETIDRGEPIAEIETDKVNLEIEAFDGGVVHKHLVTEGETVPVGEPIAIIGEPGEVIDEPSIPAAAEAAASQPSQPATPAATNGAGTTTLDGTADQVFERAPGERVRASPLVKRLAAEHGIDLHAIRGTGPGGRIVKADILPHVGRPATTPVPSAPAPSAPEVGRVAPVTQVAPAPAPIVAPVASPTSETRDLTRIRKTIARRMSESFQQAPHFYITMPVDMGKALRLRQEINEQVEAAQKVSINDLVVKATALALRKFPVLNASFAGESIQIHQRIDISIAVAIEEGLISPFIPDTDHKPLGAIAAASKDLIERARHGGLKPEEYQGGTFTISNLGMYGIESFSAIINPPQVAILAVGSVTKEPIYQDGQFVPADIMRVTISADHRVTDGAEAARFLAELKHLLEQPMLLVVN
jgi:pyruvate dehydrogenase E2 component (dihydrolipoamide acetyltransferase)